MLDEMLQQEILTECHLRPAKRMGLKVACILLNERLSCRDQETLMELLSALTCRLARGQKI